VLSIDENGEKVCGECPDGTTFNEEHKWCDCPNEGDFLNPFSMACEKEPECPKGEVIVDFDDDTAEAICGKCPDGTIFNKEVKWCDCPNEDEYLNPESMECEVAVDPTFLLRKKVSLKVQRRTK